MAQEIKKVVKKALRESRDFRHNDKKCGDRMKVFRVKLKLKKIMF